MKNFIQGLLWTECFLSPFPNSCAEAPNLQCNGTWRGDFYKVTGLDEDMGGVLLMGVYIFKCPFIYLKSPYKKRGQGNCFSPYYTPREAHGPHRVAIYKSGQGPSPRPESVGSLILDFPASVRNTLLVFKSPSLQCFVIATGAD